MIQKKTNSSNFLRQKEGQQRQPLSEKEATQKAEALCVRRECCVSEVEEKLFAWGLTGEAQQRIVEHLLQERYIDEGRFSRAYALDKLRYNHWGRVKIGQMLRLLGISAEDRQAALDELPTDEYLDILQRLIATKWPTIQGRSTYERQAKLMRFLAGRGFEPNVARDYVPGADDWTD